MAERFAPELDANGGDSSERSLAEARQTLAVLDAQADAVRVELATLRKDLAKAERAFDGRRSAELLEANERLVLAALNAENIAARAVHKLAELTRSSQRDAPTDTPDRGQMLDRRESARREEGPGEAGSAATETGVPGKAGSRPEPVPGENEPGLATLREANEQLLIAALTAQDLRKRAEEARRRQVTFLAMVAHELRNPMAPIRTATDMLKHARTNEPLQSQLESIIKRQVTHMARLVDDLLDDSSINTGQFRIERSSVEVADFVGLAVETCQSKIDAKRQRLTVQLPAGPLVLQGDPVRLAQVICNLLENASKYTQDGGRIALVASVQEHALTITVSDNGIGIDASDLPDIFDLFVQEARARAHDTRGLGIGLAVVRALAEAHGGSVTASSAGRELGSEFVVTLPISD